jgi:hypothetical protein
MGYVILPHRRPAVERGTPLPIISRHHLIANKKASGRLQDLADVLDDPPVLEPPQKTY